MSQFSDHVDDRLWYFDEAFRPDYFESDEDHESEEALAFAEAEAEVYALEASLVAQCEHESPDSRDVSSLSFDWEAV